MHHHQETVFFGWFRGSQKRVRKLNKEECSYPKGGATIETENKDNGYQQNLLITEWAFREEQENRRFNSENSGFWENREAIKEHWYL